MYRLTIEHGAQAKNIFVTRQRHQANTAFAVALAAHGVTASPTLDRLSARTARISWSNAERTVHITAERAQ